jgi:predicted transcriptional regulator
MLTVVNDGEPMRGELQQEVMRTLWHTGDASVEEVRCALPQARRSAYTTIQTVLNRLADRGLVSRARAGRVIRYRARISEADYLSRSLDTILAGASEEARRGALVNLAERLPADELAALRRAGDGRPRR